MQKYNSHIKVRCKCAECAESDKPKAPTMSCFGFFYGHLPEDLKEKAGTRAKVAIKNRNKRTEISRNLHKAQKEANGGTLNSDLWFTSKRHQMTGFCLCGCNTRSSKEDDVYWKFSAAHILSKAKFKSIAWHPDNWVELSFWNGCHTVFDNMGYEFCKNTKPVLWKIVVEKFKKLYPFIHHSEVKHIPNVLLETL